MSTYSPKQLYLEFSNDYCDPYTLWGKRKVNWGKGAAYDIDGITKLLKLLPYPCLGIYGDQVSRSPDENIRIKYGDFNTSGQGRLALPYKFLQILDPDAFKEIQQSPYASVAHALRNAADLSRACKIFWDSRTGTVDELYKWEGRGATEPIYHYANNSLAKAIMFTGPNFIRMIEASEKANGCDEMGCMPALLTADYSCQCPPEKACPPEPKQCKIGEECAKLPCVKKAQCANEAMPNSGDFRIPNSISYYIGGRIKVIAADNWTSLLDSDKSEIINRTELQHAGYFVRKSYGGHGNFISHGNYYGAQDDTLLVKFGKANNNMDYDSAQYDINISKKTIFKTKRDASQDPPINRIKNVSLVTSVGEVKDCLYNGYGVVISTNVGFSDKRDSIGISYPDRLWYHTMAIIGYDDTKTIYPECLYLFANSWGNWNYGGEPDWGPIPEGSFLVTESHLACILNKWPRVDTFKDCNPITLKRCFPYFLETGSVDWFRPPTSLLELDAQNFTDRRDDRAQPTRWARFTCNNTRVIHTSEKMCNQRMLDEVKSTLNCGDSCVQMTDCDYTSCGSNQSPWGMAFAISFDEDLPFFRKEMKYSQFFLKPTVITNNKDCKKALYNARVYLSACHYCEEAIFDVILGGVNIGQVNLNTSLATAPCVGGWLITEAPPITLTPSIVNAIQIVTNPDGSCQTSITLQCTLPHCHESLSDIRIVAANGYELVPFYHIGDTTVDIVFKTP